MKYVTVTCQNDVTSFDGGEEEDREREGRRDSFDDLKRERETEAETRDRGRVNAEENVRREVKRRA